MFHFLRQNYSNKVSWFQIKPISLASSLRGRNLSYKIVQRMALDDLVKVRTVDSPLYDQAKVGKVITKILMNIQHL
jgi:hypothetical protein